ncbi:MAG: 4Fe-4S dicluster domain-containing protein [Promethearchaeota archaeon]|nr:MAG: 4Fe-4S dicluster domain-containing protein [Candidatus Lokiarchaeota archaeon]
MSNNDYYEIVRQKLEIGPIKAPKHEKIYELMKIFWPEDVINVLSYFPNAGESITVDELVDLSGIPKTEIKKALRKAHKKKTIIKAGRKYELAPIVPGIFEAYFIAQKDTEENLKKAAKIYRYLFENANELHIHDEGDYRLFSPILPYQAKEKLIKIDESLDAESQVLPYELVEEMINKNEHFAVIPCQCRLIAELNGESCDYASSDMGCLLVGFGAQAIANFGFGRALTKEEAIEYLKETEKAGLVHNASDDTSPHSFICNCCPDHCGALAPMKKFGIKNIRPSNFQPKIDHDLCVQCKTCVKKCPMDVISYSESENKMEYNLENCIGCGLCATNCPKEAISMEKVANFVPRRKNKIGDKKTFGEILEQLLV